MIKEFLLKSSIKLVIASHHRGLFVSTNTAAAAAAAAKSLQSCPTLCDPTDRSPPGSPVPGILQARTLEWVAISFSNAWNVKVKSLSGVQLLMTPWTAAYQAPPSMGFSRQEYWSGVPLPSPDNEWHTQFSFGFTRARGCPLWLLRVICDKLNLARSWLNFWPWSH